MPTKVAVVTGSNRGIGFGIVRGLCKRFDGDVYLTSRDINRGQNAVAELNKEGLRPKYHQLDITDPKSVEKLRDHLKENYGGIDILVNNAAIAFKTNAPEPVIVQAEQTLFVNFYSVLSTCQILFPILRNGARVVNITSSCGHLTKIKSEKLRNRFKDPNLTIEGLCSMLQEYIDAAKQGTQAADWGNSSYAVAKVAITALSKIQQRMYADRGIIVNAVNPGYAATDMTLHRGPLTIDEAARAPVYLALDAPDSVKGQYIWKDKTAISWEEELADPDYIL
ncbi:carbonyl reductase [NADPH] 3-like [Pieris napi]|uniref:carbonyl reductase [NADPH] 3-like n=1 Tax=Pieris napi TaxID=78633 RepID=UPI001FB99445|nr:carbonyl reductase [NADPH] 3-like [Pieris napi]